MTSYYAQLKQCIYKVRYGEIAYEEDIWETRT
jgi:hypothetical protein